MGVVKRLRLMNVLASRRRLPSTRRVSEADLLISSKHYLSAKLVARYEEDVTT